MKRGSEGMASAVAAKRMRTETSAAAANGEPEVGLQPPMAEEKKVESPLKPPALTFPYKLDPFQVDSIAALEAGESVLVSAHTSAGKTTVALYAIAKALKEKKRVIYTSPIKALSNQKFREFDNLFGSVGLLTGDTTIRSDADCLVMTTEILRSMLYRGTEILREVGCVVFDEVHYLRDKSRGVVWEETIIMLPEGCQYVFLSATIPNAQEFADWVEHIHPQTKCRVIYTDTRPVPLQHFLYPEGSDGIFLILDERNKFHEENFNQAMGKMHPDRQGTVDGGGGRSSNHGGGRTGSKFGGNRKSIAKIIQLVMDNGMAPCIIFSFAKVECEKNALSLSKQNFNTQEEDATVLEVYNNALETLSADDRQLPAVEHLLPLLRRGIGIHHSGLLPILKEVVEILFQAGLVKALFSTETFSLGLNMPARTVVFTSVKKFDGENTRYLTSGEYIQMSGRAGRRGLDRVGVVISMIEETIEPDTLRQLTSGKADVLLSSFHLTYNMILNLLRVEDVDPEYMMSRSFAQFQRERNRPQLEQNVAALNAQIKSLAIEDEDVFEEFMKCSELSVKLKKDVSKALLVPKYVKPYLQPGRVLHIIRANDQREFFWGICIGYDAKEIRTEGAETADVYTVDVAVDRYLVCCQDGYAKRSYNAVGRGSFIRSVRSDG